MDTGLILAWLGIGVLTDYMFYRLVLKDLDFKLLDLVMLMVSLVFWPLLLMSCLLILADNVTLIRRRDR